MNEKSLRGSRSGIKKSTRKDEEIGK